MLRMLAPEWCVFLLQEAPLDLISSHFCASSALLLPLSQVVVSLLPCRAALWEYELIEDQATSSPVGK